jgi:hypothetical protein
MSVTLLHKHFIIPTNSTSVTYKEGKDNKGGKEDGTGVHKNLFKLVLIHAGQKSLGNLEG